MAVRTVFEPQEKKPYYRKVPVEFDFHPGQSMTQKRKNLKALHEGYQALHPGKTVLEVSTKSEEAKGQALSPFHLKRTLRSLQKDFPVENIFHASKAWKDRGPFYDLLGTTPLEAKQDARVQSAADHYVLEGQTYPARPDVLFYNWLYGMAVLENGLEKTLFEADAFTDIEFSGTDGNCQARACAVTRSLLEQKKLKKNMSFADYSALFLESDLPEAEKLPEMKYREPEAKASRTVFSVGDVLNHPGFGQGQVYKKTARDYTILFPVSGPKTLRRDIVETRCRKV